jgi:hypothetical protein
MRKFLASASVLVFAASAMAQDTNCNHHQFCTFDDGTAENSWKIAAPSGAGDYFNVDFGDKLHDRTITAISANANETGGLAGTWDLGIYENCAVGVPNLLAPVCLRPAAPVNAGDNCATDNCYSVACCVVDSSSGNGHSATVHMNAGDSHIWLCADSLGTINNRSYFTTSSYAGCTSIPFTVNWMIRVGLQPEPGTLMVNGGSSATVTQNDEVCFVFYGPTFKTPGILFLVSPAVIKLLSITTDTFAPGPCPNSWALCAQLSCDSPTFSGFDFGHFYFDFIHLKANGKPAIKLSTVTLSILPGRCGGGAFGQKDDCVLDATIWKVQNPAGPSDWFNVQHGTADASVNNITGVEMDSWDFCGTGPTWAEVGVYGSNLGVDPAGCTPDLGNVCGNVLGAGMAPAAADWGCPATFYDISDCASDTTTIYHVASKWNTGDTCTWLGSDTDGIDSPNGAPIPNNGCCSLFTLNNYTTAAVRFTAANWMQRITWN